MSKHRFIVLYDTATEQWSWDTETEAKILPNSIEITEQKLSEMNVTLASLSDIEDLSKQSSLVDVKAGKALMSILDLTNGLIQKDLSINLISESDQHAED
jgi:hypothetical protein